MTRHQKDPLRSLSAEAVGYLETVSRSYSDRASRVTRAKILLTVAGGCPYTEAAHRVGGSSGDAVAA